MAKFITLFFIFHLLLTANALAAESYRFERMWPTLQQPWYFKLAGNIAIDKDGYIYITDAFHNRVQKFTSDWNLLTYWGKYGSEKGQFSDPEGIVIDKDGTVYVADAGNHRIQKFDKNGVFLAAWGSHGTGDGEFDTPFQLAIDEKDCLYVTEQKNHRVQKLTSEGKFVSKWGSEGSGNGQFITPAGITVDNEGYVYVVDPGNYRIQKFDAEGNFIYKWGSILVLPGSNDTRLMSPQSIVADRDNFIYVSEIADNIIHKFKADGTQVLQWGEEGNAGGQFRSPAGLALDADGFLYVADLNNYRFQKFTRDGEYISEWGSSGSSDGKFNRPYSMAQKDEFIYVLDRNNHRVQKFLMDGIFVKQWGSEGTDNGQFSYPEGIAVDNKGFVYICDTYNNRVQKFDSDGNFILKWSGNFPGGIAVDDNGTVYVTESAFLKEKYDFYAVIGLAEYITSVGLGWFWGYNNPSSETSEQTDSYETVLFEQTDQILKLFENAGLDGLLANRRSGESALNDVLPENTGFQIQKYDTEGNPKNHWEMERGTKNICLKDIAVDSEGFVYVTDCNDFCIQKFTADGTPMENWACETGGISEDLYPESLGISIDKNDNIYLADAMRDRIRIFQKDGTLLTEFGEAGSVPGAFGSPHDLFVSLEGKLYVSDANNRIQIFRKGLPTDKVMKSVIIAGGGPYEDNFLWEDTQMCANFAYRTLAYQGFTKESIYYLTSDTTLDLDSNGEADDVDGDALNTNLKYAITQWAKDADSLVIYLIDHGRPDEFVMSASENLAVSQLAEWLNILQTQSQCNEIIFVYDACKSGSFLAPLTMAPEGKKRIIITSTSPDEEAQFVTQGSVSFSNYFWTHIFNGLDIKNAFPLAEEAIGKSFHQHPLLDANGDGQSNKEDYPLTENLYIGNGTKIQGQAPAVESVSARRIGETNSVQISASNVSDEDGITKVWAVIRPPDFSVGLNGKTLLELPSALLQSLENGNYEGIWDGCSIAGTYQIAVYAMDRIGNTSIPQITEVSVDNPLRRKAVIIAGGEQTDELWPVIEKNTNLSYEALRFQGYSDDDIYFLSPVTFSAGVDVAPTLDNIDFALGEWIAQDTQDLVMYMIGTGQDGQLKLNAEEGLSAAVLKTKLDTVQDHIPGKVTLIYDAGRSGSFVSALVPPEGKQRILISSAARNEPAVFLMDGSICFSRFFWRYILNGANTEDAFKWAKTNIRHLGQFYNAGQIPQLDDNGNGIGNEKTDGAVARDYKIGLGIMLADGIRPAIKELSSEIVLKGETSADIWADVTAAYGVESVHAVLVPPEDQSRSSSSTVTKLSSSEMTLQQDIRYQGQVSGFDRAGTYRAVVYATDAKGELSAPGEILIRQTVGPDIYEDDDSIADAKVIVLNRPKLQYHNFDKAGDEDYVKFYGLAEQTYRIEAQIEVQNPEADCDIMIDILDATGNSVLDEPWDEETGDESFPWPCQQNGIYYVKFYNYNSDLYGQNTGYYAGVILTVAPDRTQVYIPIEDVSGNPVTDAVVQNQGNVTGISEPATGNAEVWLSQNQNHSISVSHTDFNTLITKMFTVGTNSFTLPTVTLSRTGDVSRDTDVGLGDAIIALQVLAGIPVTADKSAALENEKIGLADAVFVLQKVAGLR